MPNLNQIGDAAPARVDLIRPNQRAGAAPEPFDGAPAGDRTDQVELSSLARSFQDPGVRTELVQRVRAEIDSGGYETDERIDRAAEALARALRG